MPAEHPLKPLSRLAVPTLVVSLALYATFHNRELIERHHALLVTLPYLILTAALLLALQFNRLRLFMAGLIGLATYTLIQQGLQQALANPPAHYLYSLLSLALPCNLALLAVLPERGLRSGYASLAVLLLAIQALAGYLFYSPDWAFPVAYRPWLALQPAPGHLPSITASGLFGLSALLLLTLGYRRNSDTEAVLLACLAGNYLVLLWLSQPFISSLLFGACGLCLIYGVFRSSHDMAFRDDLTGLRNRRAFNDRLRGLRRHYTIATLDVDHFKKFNDTHGHEVGDDVLRLVAARISQVGGGGIPYRYGGEEFCIVFAGKPAAQCVPHLEAVRLAIEHYPMVLRNQKQRPSSDKLGKSQRNRRNTGSRVSVTVSIGVAERSDTCSDATAVLKGSDSALYQAKKAGRNRLQLA